MNNFSSPNPSATVNSNRRIFFDDSCISLNSKGQQAQPGTRSQRLNEDLFPGPSDASLNSIPPNSAFHTNNLSRLWFKEPVSSSASVFNDSSLFNKLDVSLGPALNSSVQSRINHPNNTNGINNSISFTMNNNSNNNNSSANGNSSWLDSSANFHPTDNIVTGSSTTSAAPSTTNSTSASLSSNPISFSSFNVSYGNNKNSVLNSAVDRGFNNGNVDSFSFNGKSAFSDQPIFGSMNINNTSSGGLNNTNTNDNRNNLKTNSTTTPLFKPFDAFGNNSNNTISSYLDINTSSLHNNKNNTLNNNYFGNFSQGHSANQNNKGPRYQTSSANETPLTTPVLSSNLYSRFFPSPTSERIRQNYSTAVNTPSASRSHNNNNGNCLSDQITHLNLSSSLNIPTEPAKNSASDPFYFDPSLGSGIILSNAGNNNTNRNSNNQQMNNNSTSGTTSNGGFGDSLFNGGNLTTFNPSSSILDTLRNKSADSFDMAFSQNNEDLVPNFVYDELHDNDTDILSVADHNKATGNSRLLPSFGNSSQRLYNGNDNHNTNEADNLNSGFAFSPYSGANENGAQQALPNLNNLSLNRELFRNPNGGYGKNTQHNITNNLTANEQNSIFGANNSNINNNNSNAYNSHNFGTNSNSNHNHNHNHNHNYNNNNAFNEIPNHQSDGENVFSSSITNNAGNAGQQLHYYSYETSPIIGKTLVNVFSSSLSAAPFIPYGQATSSPTKASVDYKNRTKNINDVTKSNNVNKTRNTAKLGATNGAVSGTPLSKQNQVTGLLSKPERPRSLVSRSDDLEAAMEDTINEQELFLQKNNNAVNDVFISFEGFNLGSGPAIESESANKQKKEGEGSKRDDNSADIGGSLDIFSEEETVYPEGFSSTFYKRADNNFMFVREIQAKSTIIKFRSVSIIEFRLSLPTMPLFALSPTLADEASISESSPTKKGCIDSSSSISSSSEGLAKKKKYKSYAVQINLNELEGKIGGLRVSKQQALQQQQKQEGGSFLASSGSPGSSSTLYRGQPRKRNSNSNSGGQKHSGHRRLSKQRGANAYYYKKGYSNKVGAKASA